jgi:diguanylate cyclase (GGDEF)-like protein
MSSEAEEPGVDVERCLDGLAAALRAWGRNAFDVEDAKAADIGAAFEAWARHLLLSTPPPEYEEWTSQEKDWPGLDRFVTGSRKAEHDYVVNTLRDLRQVVLMFTEVISRSMTADQKSDDKLLKQMNRLQDAAKGSDAAALKSEALRSASLIEGAISVRVARYQSHIEKLSDRLENMASELLETRERGAIDPLTGAYNRAALDERLTMVTCFGKFVGDSAIVFMIDIDHFKWVNDKYGHQAGDDLLRKVARRLKQALRRENDFIARYGGDEFVAIAHGRSPDQLREVAERIQFSIREVEIQCEGEKVRVSASIGAARLLRSDDLKSWLKRADEAMYRAKQAGRDRFEIDTGEPGTG